MKNDKNEDKKKEREEQEETLNENEEVVELREQVADFENKYKRALADYQNLEKRVVEDRRNWIKMANKELVLRLMPILDTLMLAAKHVQNEGLTLSINQFVDALKQEGIERIDTKNKMFDPHLMECIQTIEGEDGKVLDEVRAGYKMYDTVLRPAQVVVGKES